MANSRETFLHLVAESADTKTLKLFLGGSLKRRATNVKNKHSLTPLQVGLARKDVDAEWKAAFLDFLRAIDKDLPEVERSKGSENPPQE